MLATGAELAAAGAVLYVTVDSDQLELTAARNSPPFTELSLEELPTVKRSFAAATDGHPVPAPTPDTVNFIRNSLTGLVSTVNRLPVPNAVAGADASIVASSVAANVNV
jgi:hypothetical protein